MIPGTKRHPLLYLAGSILAPLFCLVYFYRHASAGSQLNREDGEMSLRAFREVASVLTGPRCLNCHVPDEGPLQGDDSHPHAMNVKRGPDGKGSAALHCSACHQTENSKFLHGPPGAAAWQLPSPMTPMAWKGLSTSQLCRALKDPGKNGNRSLQDLIVHMDTPLVRWAWSPGPGRTLPPLSHDEFISRLKEWIEYGAACPD